jgi:hypothetical protein
VYGSNDLHYVSINGSDGNDRYKPADNSIIPERYLWKCPNIESIDLSYINTIKQGAFNGMA